LLLIVNTGGKTEVAEAAVKTMLEHQVDSIIYSSMFHTSVRPPAALSNVPCVLLDCYAEDRSLPSVVPDEVQGGRTATETLLNKGHRRIGFINNVDPIPATFGRLEGYKQALASYGVPFDPSLVYGGRIAAEEGYRCAVEL